VGVGVLGAEEKDFWKDHKGALVNSIRTRTALERADVVVVKFGEKYRQWNAAFDAGYAVALGKQLIVIHPPEFTHALKEVDGSAQAVAETSAQVVEVLKYVTVQD
jgi:YtoQ family protein